MFEGAVQVSMKRKGQRAIERKKRRSKTIKTRGEREETNFVAGGGEEKNFIIGRMLCLKRSFIFIKSQFAIFHQYEH